MSIVAQKITYIHPDNQVLFNVSSMNSEQCKLCVNRS